MTLRVGVMGAGNISSIYFENDHRFQDFSLVAVADIIPEAAQKAAATHGVAAYGVEEMLARDDVDAILNLTIPAVHADVSRQALEAGKHVYSEKPLSTELADGAALMELADKKGLRVGCAPDTILGPGVQRARQMIDGGDIGKPLSVNAAVMSHGMEDWHPNPHFFFQPGAGPVLDIGPYYIAALINLLGPVDRVVSIAQIGFPERIVGAEGPHNGERIPVNTPTTVHAVMAFKSGAQATFLASWDVWKHGMESIEIHGETASMRVPDPNFFGGAIEIARSRSDDWQPIETDDGVWGAANWPGDQPRIANYRGLGLADMAAAIKEGRPHRASGEVALHTVAAMLAILKSAETGKAEPVDFTCERPALLTEEQSKALQAS
ncbi:MAG: Gfo/Idh/MocA family oxidoreductase [Pseudomonadota bacterium]